MRRSNRWLRRISVMLVLLTCAPAVAQAQIDPPPTYAGDLWSRPRLTGDWFGGRDWLAKHGVTFDLDLTQVLQGVSSGRTTGVSYDGIVNYELNTDTGKMGLWPGGFLKVQAYTTYGTLANDDSGALVPVNVIGILPQPDDNIATGLMNLTFAQFLSTWFGVAVGKFNTLTSGDDNAFAHSFNTQFLNTALNFNTVLDLAPFSAYGGTLIFLPWKGAIFTVSVVDPSGTATDNDISKAFSDGVFVGAEGRVEIKPFGLVGHQDLGFFWSDKTRLSIDQDPSNIARLLVANRFPRFEDPGPLLRRLLERFFPQLLVPVQPARTEGSTWAVYYNFDQYLWSPEGHPDRGVGMFFRFGISDGNPNPVKYAYNVGLSANGVIPGRPKDSIGLGWARTQISTDFVPFLRQQFNLGLNVEDAVELYYNAVLAPWLNLSASMQVVDSAVGKTISSNGRLVDMPTTVVGGLRMYVRF
jgi:porin